MSYGPINFRKFESNLSDKKGAGLIEKINVNDASVLFRGIIAGDGVEISVVENPEDKRLGKVIKISLGNEVDNIETQLKADEATIKDIVDKINNLQSVANDEKSTVSDIQSKIADLEKTLNQLPEIKNDIDDLQKKQVKLESESQNTGLAVPGVKGPISRRGLSLTDVKTLVNYSRIQKWNGQVYAGKYSLTPQLFPTNSEIPSQPYGNPGAKEQTYSINQYSWPIITDSVYQYYDSSTGIHLRWDQFEHDSKAHLNTRWLLDGLVLSVSPDGITWTNVGVIDPDTSGNTIKTGVFVDRDNKLGYGSGVLWTSSNANGWYLLNPYSTGPSTSVGYTPSTYGDHRVYWEQQFNKFSCLSVYDNNTKACVRMGDKLSDMQDAFVINEPIFDGLRVECPSWVSLKDTVTGKVEKVVSFALQSTDKAATPINVESFALGTIEHDQKSYKMTNPLRYIEYGKFAYAQHLVDPKQQDGTGGTNTYADEAVMNVGSFEWSVLNNGTATPAFGFAGGSWIPAKVILENGIPKCLPNDLFESKMTGKAYRWGLNDINNLENTLPVDVPAQVWRAEIDLTGAFGMTDLIQFNFGNYSASFTIEGGAGDNQNGLNLQAVLDTSGTVVLFPIYDANKNVITNNLRALPLVTSTDQNTAQLSTKLVVEYDYGRMRLYNTNLGVIMSEMIFPGENPLTSIVPIFANASNITISLKLDGGEAY